MRAVANRRLSKSLIVEEALWREIGRMTPRDKTRLIQRMKYVDGLISEIIAIGTRVESAGEARIPGTPVDVHKKEARRERRNELSQKAHTAMNQLFDLAQSEALAQENQARAATYKLLAHVAAIDAQVLRDTTEEEILEAVEKLYAEQREYEEATRRLEAETKAVAGKKQER